MIGIVKIYITQNTKVTNTPVTPVMVCQHQYWNFGSSCVLKFFVKKVILLTKNTQTNKDNSLFCLKNID